MKWLTLIIVAFASLAQGQSGETMTGPGTKTPPYTITVNPACPPQFNAIPNPYTFPSTAIGSNASQVITIYNTGCSVMAISGNITSSNAQFTLSSDTCSNNSNIGPGASCPFTAIFTPTAIGPQSATLTVPDDTSTGPDSIILSGTGLPAPAPSISCTPLTLPFGNVTTGTSSSPQTVTCTNSGTATLTISSVTSNNSPVFLISGNTCSSVPTSGTCTFNVTFSPTSTGYQTATITVANNSSTPSYTVSANGTGVSGFTATYYISPAAGTTACSAGSDSNDGKAATTGGGHGPWLTPGHAQTVLRTVSKTSPISVAICGGTANANSINPIPDYYNVALNMTSLDSGASGNVVTWENYPGESPALSGGTKITTLALSTTDICTNIASCYQTSIANTVPYFERLYYNGGDRLRPRLGATATNLIGQYGHSTGTLSSNSAFTFSPLGIVNTITNAVPVPYPSCNLSSPNDCEINAFTKWVAYIERISSFSNPVYLPGLNGSLTNWSTCGSISCAGGSAVGTPTLTTGITTPSLTGNAMKAVCSGASGANCLYWYSNGPENNTTAFTCTWHFYLDANGHTANALEYDCYQYLFAGDGGATLNTRLMWGTQCDQNSGLIQIWDAGGGGWQNTSPTIACSFPLLSWNTIVWNVHRVTGDTSCGAGYPKEYYDTLTVTVNGVTTTNQVNNTTCAGALPGTFAEATGIQHQLDIGSSGSTLTEYLDEYLYAGSSLQINTTCGSSCPSANAGPGSPYQNGYRYTLDNVKELFQYPGQWFLDRSSTNPNNPNWTLSYIANAGENPTTDTIVVGNNAEVISAEALSYWTFTGLNFMHDNWTVPATGYLAQQQQSQLTNALVACDNCTSVIFSGDTFGQTTTTGLQFTAASSNFTATGNIAYDTGGAGYRIGLAPSATSHTATDTQVPNNGTISQNWSVGFDRFLVDSYGIQVGLANTLTVSNNDVHYGYNTGIGTCIPGYPGPNQCASPASGNHGDFNLTYTGNDVGNIGEGVTTDLGAYYMMTSRATGTYSLSTTVAPVNVGTNSWQYTFATTQSGAGSNAWLGWGVDNSGFTPSTNGNNGNLLIVTASTTTTVTLTNANGNTTNTGTPLLTTIGTATGNSFTGNRGHDVNSSVVNGDTADTMGHCLYLDGSTGLWSVQNNLLYRCTGMGLNMNFGPAASSIGNIINNNVFLNAGPEPSGTASIRVQSPLNTVNEFSATSNIFSMALSTNVNANAQTGPPYVSASTYQTYASNIWNYTGTPVFNIKGASGNIATSFPTWKSTYGEDTAGTISTSPGFTAPDYCPSNSTVPTAYCDNFSFTNGTGPGFGFNGSVFTNTYGPTVRITPPTVVDTFPIATLPPSSFGGTLVACGPPGYLCARRDLAIDPVGGIINVPPQVGPNVCTSGNLTNCGNYLGANTCTVDPDFATPICRMSDSNTLSTHVTLQTQDAGGSRIWNCTGLPACGGTGPTYITLKDTGAVRWVYQFNPTTMQTNQTGVKIGDIDTAWGRVTTNGTRLWTLGDSTDSTYGTIIKHVDFTVNTLSFTRTTQYDLGNSNCLGNAVNGVGGTFTTTWFGDFFPSFDDNVFGAAFSNQSPGSTTGIYVAAYNVSTGVCSIYNTQTGVVTNNGVSIGTVTVPDRFTLHEANPNPAGNAFQVGPSTCITGTCPIIAWIPFTTTATECAGGNCGGHSQNGYTVWENGTGTGNFTLHPWSSFGTETNLITNSALIPSGLSSFPGSDQHATWIYNNSSDGLPIFASYTGTGESTNTPFNSAWQMEIVGTSQAGIPFREGHVFNSGVNVQFDVNNNLCQISPDGQFMACSSDWLGTLGSLSQTASCVLTSTCRGDVFVYKLQ